MARRIYMDNSATSFPKPPEVIEAMVRFARECGASAGRGAYAEARACAEVLARCRRRLAELIDAESPERIVFAMNCSEALMIGLRGLLNTAGDAHAVATAMEHNSILRPLNALAEQTHLRTTIVEADASTGLVDPAAVAAAIRPQTRLICAVHVSNVTGTIQPIGEIAAVARRAGVPLLVDSAQAAGRVSIDVRRWGADMVAFPGHKGLGGPLGTGVLYVRPGLEDKLPTMKEGGTGTVSELPIQPQTMPEKYEIGSHNAIGVAGLGEGVAWVLGRGIDELRRHDRRLCEVFLEETDPAGGLTVYGPRELDDRTGIFSVNVEGCEPQALAGELEKRFGVLTRAGVHCAPLAHETIGTHPTGTCRLSFGPFTTVEDVRYAAGALCRLASSPIPAG